MNNLGYDVARITIKRILSEHGTEPAPERSQRTAWRTILKAHWGAVAAMNFFTAEAVTLTGLVRYFVLIVVDLRTRRVEVAGIVHRPNGQWMAQVARNPTDVAEGLKSPSLNAYDERFVRSIKEECLSRIVPLCEAHLRYVVREFTAHYCREERNHQGLDNQPIMPSGNVSSLAGRIQRRQRVGRLLNYYYRDGA